MPIYVDAEKLEKDGWSASRTYPQDAKTMVYETKKLTDFPTTDEEKIATDFCMKRGLVMVTIGSWETLLAYYQRGTGL